VYALPAHDLPPHFVAHVDGGGNMATLKRYVADIFRRHEPLRCVVEIIAKYGESPCTFHHKSRKN
jgi:hypothetical protein